MSVAGFLKYIAPSAYFSDDKECFAFFYSHFPFFFRSMAVDSASKTPYTDATQVRNPMTRVVQCVCVTYAVTQCIPVVRMRVDRLDGRVRACVRPRSVRYAPH